MLSALGKLRGWAFRPVLVQETELYSSYISQWTQLNELVAQCSRSMFDGGSRKELTL